MMLITIDRLEGKTAVVQDAQGNCYDMPAALLEGAREGASYTIEKAENPYRERIQNLMDEVWEDASE